MVDLKIDFSTGTASVVNNCPKCGKPYIYVGDWFGIDSPVCECRTMTTDSSSSWVYWYYPRQGWQCPKCHRINSPDVKTCICLEICSICGKAHEYTITVPYGSERDGDVICVECLDAMLEKSKK